MRSAEKHFLSCFCVFTINLESNKWRKRSFSEQSLANICLVNLRISQFAIKPLNQQQSVKEQVFFYPNPVLKTLYYCLVYPFFHYCIIVWVSTYKTNPCRLVSLQKRVLRIVSRDYRCSLRPYFQRIGAIKNFPTLVTLDSLMFSLNNGHSLLPLRFKDYFSFHKEV